MRLFKTLAALAAVVVIGLGFAEAASARNLPLPPPHLTCPPPHGPIHYCM